MFPFFLFEIIAILEDINCITLVTQQYEQNYS